MVKEVVNKDDIVLIWSEAFGDTKEDILYFADNVKNAKCLGVYDNDTLQSMLYLVDCRIKNDVSHYVYAACTFEKYRNNGCMSKLLDYCKKNYNDVCLIPANEGLVGYYKNRGLTLSESINDIKFDEIDGIVDYLFEGCELEKPFLQRYKGE